MENKDWTFMYSEGHSMLMNEAFFNAFTDYKKVPGIVEEILYVNRDTLEVCYCPKSELGRIRKQGKIFFSAAYRKKFQKDIYNCARRFFFVLGRI